MRKEGAEEEEVVAVLIAIFSHFFPRWLSMLSAFRTISDGLSLSSSTTAKGDEEPICPFPLPPPSSSRSHLSQKGALSPERRERERAGRNRIFARVNGGNQACLRGEKGQSGAGKHGGRKVPLSRGRSLKRGARQ